MTEIPTTPTATAELDARFITEYGQAVFDRILDDLTRNEPTTRLGDGGEVFRGGGYTELKWEAPRAPGLPVASVPDLGLEA